MTNEFERELVYETVFEFLTDYCIDILPTPLEMICDILQIELVPLSHLEDRGMRPKDVFALWGNEDGAISVLVDHRRGNVTAKISYNDHALPERQRFTIAEEIMHYLLGHYVDERCNILSKEFDEDFYHHCDELARIGAGLLLCPPAVFYEAADFFNADAVAQVCGLSRQCAAVRCEIMKEYQEEIRSSPLYRRLVLNYDDVITRLMIETFPGGTLFAF